MREQIQPEKLVPVDIRLFRKTARDINFDVYIKLSPTNIAHVFSKNTGVDYKRLAQYIQKGVTELYIHPDDQIVCQEFVSRTTEKIINDPNASPEQKVATLLNMTEQNMTEIFSQFQVSEETAEMTQKLVYKYVDLMIQSPETLSVILKLVSHGEYLYYHSIAVSIFSMFIARASGQFNQRTLELLGLGGFLHDIGSTQLPKEIVCSPTELTSDQWTQMHSHPQLGLKMIEKTQNIPDEVRYIIYQHHEESEGGGYPNGIHGPVIYYPAKIVSLADTLSALISKRPFRPAYSVEDAISIIRRAPQKYDRELVKIVYSVFSPKPKIK